MKKSVSVLCCLAMLLCLLTGCGSSGRNDVNNGDTDMTRPGVNDNSTNGANGNGVNDPVTTDNSIMGDVEQGMDNAGRAIERGMNDVGSVVGDAVEDMTRNR